MAQGGKELFPSEHAKPPKTLPPFVPPGLPTQTREPIAVRSVPPIPGAGSQNGFAARVAIHRRLIIECGIALALIAAGSLGALAAF